VFENLTFKTWAALIAGVIVTLAAAYAIMYGAIILMMRSIL
jgi:hypothetical protein